MRLLYKYANKRTKAILAYAFVKTRYVSLTYLPSSTQPYLVPRVYQAPILDASPTGDKKRVPQACAFGTLCSRVDRGPASRAPATQPPEVVWGTPGAPPLRLLALASKLLLNPSVGLVHCFFEALGVRKFANILHNRSVPAFRRRNPSSERPVLSPSGSNLTTTE